MQSISKTALLKHTPAFRQRQFGRLVYELSDLTGLTQEQFAALISVSYGTVNRWENVRVTPSELALRQIQSLMEKLSKSSSQPVQNRSKTQYFAST